MSSGKSTRPIAPSVYDGVERGGGSETIEWVSDGPMLLNRSYIRQFPVVGTGINSVGHHFMVSGSLGALLSGSAKSESDVRLNGNTAMNMTRPGSPAVSIISSAGELTHDDIPTFPTIAEWKRKARFFKNLSDSHLAWQFGWAPFISDIRKFARQVKDSDEILRRSEKNSNNSIKVGYSFPVSETTNYSHGTTSAFYWSNGALATQISGLAYDLVQTKTERTWFEGSWQGFFPGYGNAGGKSAFQNFSRRADILLGTNLTPVSLWNIAPWSWAIDWATGFDKILENCSNVMVDGMVLRNAYTMSSFRNSTTVSYANSSSNSKYWTVGSGGTLLSVSETKRRVTAVPYFGFNSPGTLTAKQVSIIAALGISNLA